MSLNETTNEDQASAKQGIQAHEFRNVKLPTFWREELRLWFTMLEREFAAYTVKADAVKSAAVVRNLDQTTMKIVLDVIEAPEDKSTYNDIKQALIGRLEKSDEENLRKLTGIELGNKKLSNLLREMSQLAGKDFGKKRTSHAMDTETPDKTARSIAERSGVTEVAAIPNAAHATGDPKDEVAKQKSQNDDLAAIMKRLSRLEFRLPKRGRNNSNSRQQNYRRRSGSRSKEATTDSKGLCYYHDKFKEESWKCRKPCSWTGPDKQRQGN
ncbi:uncharacterized protein LOC143366468 [Andrena cerasifolii]|uniref:uncharacterized protein LOC143366468 n=1 Tax=Andrena cerasifolii TaxID=2819439 RepID=UPI0040384630